MQTVPARIAGWLIDSPVLKIFIEKGAALKEAFFDADSMIVQVFVILVETVGLSRIAKESQLGCITAVRLHRSMPWPVRSAYIGGSIHVCAWL